MWQFEQAVTGLADACLEMGTPVTGGNVSFYNQTGEVAIHPTPVIGVLGVIDNVERRTPMAWGLDGELVYVLGSTRDELAGSEWAHAIHAHLGGHPAGEAFVEPQIRPPFHRDEIAEPLMSQLVSYDDGDVLSILGR